LLLIFFVSCKSTSGIITSKDEAQKMGLYKAPENKKVAVRSAAVPGKISTRASESRKTDSKRRVVDRNEDDYIVSTDDSSYMVKQLVNAASENLGVNYHGGGITPSEGFDCSGLMYSTFKKFDITLPRSSNDMAKIGRKLRDSDIKVGDLIFFRTNGKSVINHVGMVTEINPDEIKFIHSSTQKGVIISSTKEPYYERTFAQANRILE
jgi:lipoprotein Spr